MGKAPGFADWPNFPSIPDHRESEELRNKGAWAKFAEEVLQLWDHLMTRAE